MLYEYCVCRPAPFLLLTPTIGNCTFVAIWAIKRDSLLWPSTALAMILVVTDATFIITLRVFTSITERIRVFSFLSFSLSQSCFQSCCCHHTLKLMVSWQSVNSTRRKNIRKINDMNNSDVLSCRPCREYKKKCIYIVVRVEHTESSIVYNFKWFDKNEIIKSA